MVYDAISEDDTFKAAAACLAPNGKAVFVMNPPAEILEIMKGEGQTWARVSGFVYGFSPEHDVFGHQQVEHVPRLLEEGIIKVGVVYMLVGANGC